MNEEQKEELLSMLEGTANFLRGMQFDTTIPKHAKEAMESRIVEIENVVGKYIY